MKLRNLKGYKEQYILLSPYIFFLFFFYIGPMILTIILSFFKLEYLIVSTPEFIGFKNYESLAQDNIFWIAFKNSLFYILVMLPSIFILSLVIAEMLLRIKKFKRIFMIILIIPYIISYVISSAIWRAMYMPSIGFLSDIFLKLFHKNINFLSKEYVILSISLSHIWRDIGYFSLIFLSGLLSIPKEYYEAAKIDGAKSRQTFFHITLPLLKPVIFLVVFMLIIYALFLFTSIFIISAGGPGYASTNLLWYAYQVGWVNYKFGYTCCILTVFFLLVITIYLIQKKLLGGT